MSNYLKFLLISLILCCLFGLSQALFEDKRCKCVCPDPVVVNGTHTDRRLYIKNVPPDNCNCEEVVIPLLITKVNDKEFCPRCSCRFETRNTTTIRVVVIIVIWIISLLVVYMLFLMCLDPLLNKRTTSTYQEHTDDDNTEESNAMPMPMSSPSSSTVNHGNVLNRVGHQQFRWKRQVQEQRRNIYDRHAMLN